MCWKIFKRGKKKNVQQLFQTARKPLKGSSWKSWRTRPARWYPDTSRDRRECPEKSPGDLNADCLRLLRLGFVLHGTDCVILHSWKQGVPWPKLLHSIWNSSFEDYVYPERFHSPCSFWLCFEDRRRLCTWIDTWTGPPRKHRLINGLLMEIERALLFSLKNIFQHIWFKSVNRFHIWVWNWSGWFGTVQAHEYVKIIPRKPDLRT